MQDRKRTIMELEKRFWQTMADKDAKAAKRLIAPDCLITGPMGSMKIDPDRYEAMTEEGQWTLETFSFTDMEVIFPADEVAIVAYKVHQKGELKGEPMDMNCADSSTWIKDGSDWKCALHTETILQN